MRPSPQRHTLAVLRILIGLTQKEMAALLNCSVPTVQAVELGKLTLSDGLAGRVSYETGISTEWLLKGDTKAPLVTQSGLPYRKLAYEVRRSELTRPKTEASDLLHAHYALHRAVLKITALLLRTYRTDQFNLAAYKIGRALDELVQEFQVPLDWGTWQERTFKLAEKLAKHEAAVEMVEKHKGSGLPPIILEHAATKIPPLNLKEQIKETQALLMTFQRDFLAAFESKAKQSRSQRAAKPRAKK